MSEVLEKSLELPQRNSIAQVLEGRMGQAEVAEALGRRTEISLESVIDDDDLTQAREFSDAQISFDIYTPVFEKAGQSVGRKLPNVFSLVDPDPENHPAPGF